MVKSFATPHNKKKLQDNNSSSFADRLAEALIRAYKSRLIKIEETTWEKIQNLLKPDIKKFMDWLLKKNISLNKIDNCSFVLQEYQEFTLEDCLTMWSSLSKDSYERIYNLFCDFVREREAFAVGEASFLKKRQIV